ncbi:hypothetical protein LINPERHAP1_LOCUS27965 [Linum perenne]
MLPVHPELLLHQQTDQKQYTSLASLHSLG